VLSRLTFRHGVHPPEHKQLTSGARIRRLPFPNDVVLPLSQHTGKPALPIVRVGQRVERGDLIAEAQGWVSSPVHASASGVVEEIGLAPHPSGTFQPAIRIAVEPYSAQLPRPRLVPDWKGLEPKALVEAIRHAGVVGLGGAAFPTHVKLSPPDDKPIDLVIINGCECEPYLTTDHRTMVEYPQRLLLGVRIMMKVLGVARAAIGIETVPAAYAGIGVLGLHFATRQYDDTRRPFEQWRVEIRLRRPHHRTAEDDLTRIRGHSAARVDEISQPGAHRNDQIGRTVHAEPGDGHDALHERKTRLEHFRDRRGRRRVLYDDPDVHR